MKILLWLTLSRLCLNSELDNVLKIMRMIQEEPETSRPGIHLTKIAENTFVMKVVGDDVATLEELREFANPSKNSHHDNEAEEMTANSVHTMIVPATDDANKADAMITFSYPTSTHDVANAANIFVQTDKMTKGRNTVEVSLNNQVTGSGSSLEDHSIEVREYPNTTFICSMVPELSKVESGVAIAIDQLDRYISGYNSEGKMFTKNSPVFYSMIYPIELAFKLEVCYWLKQNSFQAAFPLPSDRKVYLKDMEKSKFYARSFNSELENQQEVIDSLRDDLLSFGIQFKKGVVYATASTNKNAARDDVMFKGIY